MASAELRRALLLTDLGVASPCETANAVGHCLHPGSEFGIVEAFQSFVGQLDFTLKLGYGDFGIGFALLCELD